MFSRRKFLFGSLAAGILTITGLRMPAKRPALDCHDQVLFRACAHAVKLPTAVAGQFCIVKNRTNAVQLLYPASSNAIDGLGQNNPIRVQPHATLALVTFDGTTWYSSPRLPTCGPAGRSGGTS